MKTTNTFFSLWILLSSLSPSFLLAQDSLAIYIEKGKDLMQVSQFDSAIQVFQEVIALDSTYTDAYEGIARSYFEKAEYKKAFDYITKAIEIAPDIPQLYNTRGGFMLALQMYDVFLQDFDKAVEVSRNDKERADFLTLRGGAKAFIRDFAGAYEDLTESLRYNPDDIITLNNLGSVCDEVGRGDETIFYLSRIIEIDSTFIGAYINIGFKYQLRGEYLKAIEYFDQAISLDPEQPLSYSNRSYNRLQIGDIEGAMEDINKSLEMYPGNSYAYKNRALIYIKKKDYENACKDLEKAEIQGFSTAYGDQVAKLSKKYCKGS